MWTTSISSTTGSQDSDLATQQIRYCFILLTNGSELWTMVCLLTLSFYIYQRFSILWTMTFFYHAFGTSTLTQSPASGLNPICLTCASALLDSEHSKDLVVTSGVPWGSVLGLLLFSTFINCLFAHLHGINTVLFADDTTVCCWFFYCWHFSYSITAAYDWFLSSSLQLNVAKTKCMLLHSSRHIPTSALEVQLNGHSIDRVQRYKFLGVIITDTLSWSDHLDQVCSKASRGLNLLRRLAWFLPRSALVCYYNAYMLPHLMYAAPVRSSCTKAQSTKLEGLQNFAACIVLRRQGMPLPPRCKRNWASPTCCLGGS